MRTFIIFSLILLSLSVSAQTRAYMMWEDNVSNQTFKAGDSTYITVKSAGGFTSKDSFMVTIFYGFINNGKNRKDTVFLLSYPEFEALPKQSNGTTKIGFKIPEDAQIGYARLFVRYAYFSALPFNIESVLGITEQVEEKEELKYFTLTGMEIKKPTEGLYIWRNNKGESGITYGLY